MALAAGSVLGGAGCGGSPRALPPNVILISLDTLRSDRLSCYGYERQTSPRLDALAERGALFENTIAESSWTLPSHMTMLTGTYPATHKVTLPTKTAGADVRFLAQMLQDAGYHTGASTEGGFVGEIYGFSRGFDSYEEHEPLVEKTFAGARRFLRATPDDRPFFLFLHTFAVHCPYAPPGGYADMFVSDDAEPMDTWGKCGNPYYNSVDLTEGQVRHLSDQYDGSIRQVDDLIAGLLDELDEGGTLGNTLVVVTSDHGEEFGEHGQIGHERSLYVECLRVPLVFAGPGVPPGTRSADPVGLVDLAPTVLDLLGLAVPETVEGHSLVPLMRGEPEASARAPYRISELAWKLRLRSVWTPSHHLIVQPKHQMARLFDLTVDPTEQRVSSDARVAEALRAGLAEWRTERKARRTGEAGEIELSPEQLEKLKALGYSE